MLDCGHRNINVNRDPIGRESSWVHEMAKRIFVENWSKRLKSSIFLLQSETFILFKQSWRRVTLHIKMRSTSFFYLFDVNSSYNNLHSIDRLRLMKYVKISIHHQLLTPLNEALWTTLTIPLSFLRCIQLEWLKSANFLTQFSIHKQSSIEEVKIIYECFGVFHRTEYIQLLFEVFCLSDNKQYSSIP